MLDLKIQMDGLNETLNELKNLPGNVAEEVQKATREDLRDVASILGDYPPQLPGTHYKRTGELGFGWLESKEEFLPTFGLDFDMSLKNHVDYAGDVQGGKGDNPSQLAEFRRRGWKTTDQALAETEERAQQRLEKAVQKAMDKLDQ